MRNVLQVTCSSPRWDRSNKTEIAQTAIISRNLKIDQSDYTRYRMNSILVPRCTLEYRMNSILVPREVRISGEETILTHNFYF